MNVNRRAALIAGPAATAAGAAAAATGGASAMQTKDTAPPALDGEIRLDAAARAAAADDFGHIVHETPEGVLLPGSDDDLAATIRWAAGRGRLPGSDDDLAATIRWAAGRGRSFAPRGRGHSVFGRAMARGGIVGDMTRLRTVRGVQGDRVTVEAGATWREVLAATLPQGLTPPVLTDYLDLSVGGTLIVGGVGGTTARSGAQCDNVLSMEVVTGAGRKLACAADRNAELFDAVRAGLGQVGVVTRATLRLVPAPRQVRRFLLSYPDLSTMLADERLLAGDDRFDAVQGAAIADPAGGGWAFRLDAAKGFTGTPPDDDALLAGLSDDPAKRQAGTLEYSGYLNRLAALKAALRANGQWSLPHPWLTTFVGDSRVEAVVGGELAKLAQEDLGPYGQVVLSPVRRRAVTSPLLRLPPDGLCFAFNLVRFPPTGSAAEAARLVEANRAVYARVRDAGGTLYPVSAFPMSRDDWRGHFGPAFARLAEAKRRFDPGGVLTPGYEVF